MTTTALKPRFRTLDLIYAAIFAVLITICAWISIPLVVPFTMQTFAIFLTIGLLGTKRASLSLLIYVLLGAIGLPVFSGFKGSLAVLIGPTGGYIIGFFVMILLSGIIIRRFGEKRVVLVISFLLGLVVLYAFGTAWYMFGYIGEVSWASFVSILSICVLPFIIPDIIKMVLAIVLIPILSPHIK